MQNLLKEYKKQLYLGKNVENLLKSYGMEKMEAYEKTEMMLTLSYLEMSYSDLNQLESSMCSYKLEKGRENELKNKIFLKKVAAL